MNENIRGKGTMLIQRIDRATGKVIDSEIIENTVVGTGLERIAKLFNEE